MTDEKDRPLSLRKRQDGQLHLDDPRGFPLRHEFSVDWLLENSRHVEMDDTTITLRLANGTGVYDIARDLMEEEYVKEDGSTGVRRLSTGYWGVLRAQQEVSTGG